MARSYGALPIPRDPTNFWRSPLPGISPQIHPGSRMLPLHSIASASMLPCPALESHGRRLGSSCRHQLSKGGSILPSCSARDIQHTPGFTTAWCPPSQLSTERTLGCEPGGTPHPIHLSPSLSLCLCRLSKPLSPLRTGTRGTSRAQPRPK